MTNAQFLRPISIPFLVMGTSIKKFDSTLDRKSLLSQVTEHIEHRTSRRVNHFSDLESAAALATKRAIHHQTTNQADIHIDLWMKLRPLKLECLQITPAEIAAALHAHGLTPHYTGSRLLPDVEAERHADHQTDFNKKSTTPSEKDYDIACRLSTKEACKKAFEEVKVAIRSVIKEKLRERLLAAEQIDDKQIDPKVKESFECDTLPDFYLRCNKTIVNAPQTGDYWKLFELGPIDVIVGKLLRPYRFGHEVSMETDHKGHCATLHKYEADTPFSDPTHKVISTTHLNTLHQDMIVHYYKLRNEGWRATADVTRTLFKRLSEASVGQSALPQRFQRQWQKKIDEIEPVEKALAMLMSLAADSLSHMSDDQLRQALINFVAERVEALTGQAVHMSTTTLNRIITDLRSLAPSEVLSILQSTAKNNSNQSWAEKASNHLEYDRYGQQHHSIFEDGQLQVTFTTLPRRDNTRTGTIADVSRLLTRTITANIDKSAQNSDTAPSKAPVSNIASLQFSSTPISSTLISASTSTPSLTSTEKLSNSDSKQSFISIPSETALPDFTPFEDICEKEQHNENNDNKKTDNEDYERENRDIYGNGKRNKDNDTQTQPKPHSPPSSEARKKKRGKNSNKQNNKPQTKGRAAQASASTAQLDDIDSLLVEEIRKNELNRRFNPRERLVQSLGMAGIAIAATQMMGVQLTRPSSLRQPVSHQLLTDIKDKWPSKPWAGLFGVSREPTFDMLSQMLGAYHDHYPNNIENIDIDGAADKNNPYQALNYEKGFARISDALTIENRLEKRLPKHFRGAFNHIAPVVLDLQPGIFLPLQKPELKMTFWKLVTEVNQILGTDYIIEPYFHTESVIIYSRSKVRATLLDRLQGRTHVTQLVERLKPFTFSALFSALSPQDHYLALQLISGQSLRNAERAVIDFNRRITGGQQLLLLPTQIEEAGFDYQAVLEFCMALTGDFKKINVEIDGETYNLAKLFSIDSYPQISTRFFQKGTNERELIWRSINKIGKRAAETFYAGRIDFDKLVAHLSKQSKEIIEKQRMEQFDPANPSSPSSQYCYYSECFHRQNALKQWGIEP